MTIFEFLNRLRKVKPQRDGSYLALCPAHADNKTLSLHVTLADGKILLKCFAGCEQEAIVNAMNLTMADLFTESKPETKTESKLVCTYDYKDEKGDLLFQVCRFEPKDFRPRHRNGDGDWAWNMDGVRRVLYHLPDVMLADTVYLCEGEKDADNLTDCGVLATTSPGGANNWRPEYADMLKGKKVVVMPDKDAAGYTYAKQVVQSLRNKAREMKVVLVPGDNKDFSDWLKMTDNPSEIVATLPGLEQDTSILFGADKPHYVQDNDAIKWDKDLSGHTITFRAEKVTEERTGIHGRASIALDDVSLGWSYFNLERAEDRTRIANAAHKSIKGDLSKQYSADDLRHDFDAFCKGLWDFHVLSFVPEFMEGEANPTPLKFHLFPYILQGGGTILFAPPGRGKSYSALLWAISVDAGCNKCWRVTQTPVLFINLERSRESLTRRVGRVNKVLDLPPNRPLFTLNARGKTLNEVLPACRKAIREYHVGLVVLDSISRAGLGDLNENQPVNRIIDALSSLSPSWLALGHTARKDESHLFGSIMADAGADIVIQLSTELKENTIGLGWSISKSNDIPSTSHSIYALEFDPLGLSAFRLAKPSEFVAIESKKPTNMLDTIIDYIANQDSGDATAGQITEAFGFDRTNVSKVFSNSGRFIPTRRVGHSIYYGVKDTHHD